MNVNPSQAREFVMLRRVLEQAKTFYSDPKNKRAYEKWLKEQKKN